MNEYWAERVKLEATKIVAKCSKDPRVLRAIKMQYANMLDAFFAMTPGDDLKKFVQYDYQIDLLSAVIHMCSK